jgi:hypothetical protein
MLMQPQLVLHADWGCNAKKRWLAIARRDSSGAYSASPPCRVSEYTNELSQLVPLILREIGSNGTAVIGFDFPIGLPRKYARKVDIGSFKNFLLNLDPQDGWGEFWDVCQKQPQISLKRPFYPFRAGGTSQSYLKNALGVSDIDELRRRCECGFNGRRAAAPLFWTLGPNQVGKGAIVGWRDVIRSAMRADEQRIALWPFDGLLARLLRPGTVVIVETYPALYYAWFLSSAWKGKGTLRNRVQAGADICKAADSVDLKCDEQLIETIKRGFELGKDDAFDAVVGLLGILHVLKGHRNEATVQEHDVVEGWILGR